uniref:Uncharacterized protein n=1 Tax=Ixodes ricinus TaxID=34613 RepID=A0A6B0UJE8_IXORI
MFAFVMLWKSSPWALFFCYFFIKFICFVHASTKLSSTPPQSYCPLCHRAIFSTKLKTTLCLVSSCPLSVVFCTVLTICYLSGRNFERSEYLRYFVWPGVITFPLLLEHPL